MSITPGDHVTVTDPVPGSHPAGTSGTVVETDDSHVLVRGDDGALFACHTRELSKD